ncbi:glycosyltransferase family 2 protein [Streptomyces sp. NPDC059398]|uniref:glycosyltransferase family 2 protein n=1 Tax=Streptomyces sp. NPDC059398 TaxID=3346820 RepID=UPI003674A36E
MTDMRFSIVIPYKQRLNNIRAVLTSLCEQDLEPWSFEVVIGAMEYDPAFVALCEEFTGRLRIVSVLSAEEWNTSKARNLGIRQSLGRVVVVLDADVVLATDALRNLWQTYYRHGQNVCVQGEVFGYDDVLDEDIDMVAAQPYSVYRTALEELDAAPLGRRDPRWSPEYAAAIARFPWAFVRTGFMALPASVIRDHGLLLDEGFLGWGAEDQEWGLRISRTGTPIVLGQGVRGMHLPHHRDFAAQDLSAGVTNRYYLAKWPRLELEMALALGGWLEAERHLPEVERQMDVVAGAGKRLGVALGTVGGTRVLVVGAVLVASADGHHTLIDATGAALFAPWPNGHEEVMPLLGLALPYEDATFDECHLLPAVDQLSEPYRQAVRREAGRVSKKVLPVSP